MGVYIYISGVFIYKMSRYVRFFLNFSSWWVIILYYENGV